MENEPLILGLMIMIFLLCSTINRFKYIKLLDHPLSKIIILVFSLYCVYNNNMNLAIAGLSLYGISQYNIMNMDANEAMINAKKYKQIEHFTNLIN